MPRTTTRLPRKTKYVTPSWAMTFTVPTQVVSEANLKSHFMARYRRQQEQQAAVRVTINNAGLMNPYIFPKGVTNGIAVTLTKLGGKCLDTDNLAGSMKHVQDQIARWLCIDDGDSRIEWRYYQEPGGEVGVRVTIEGRSS